MASILRSTGSGWNGGTPGTRVSVLVCTIPQRVEMFRECVEAIKLQTHKAWELLTLLDDEFEGQSVTINKLGRKARGDWVVPFDDDDLMRITFLERLLENTENADVVYAPPVVTGDENPLHFLGRPPNIPTPALIKRELWDLIGGYNEDVRQQEDRRFFEQALANHAKFRKVDEYLWVYRFHGKNKSRGHDPAITPTGLQS